MKNEVLRKDGTLSVYGLSCGYVHHTKKNSTMWKEGGVYHVSSNGLRWSFDTLAEARKNYNSL